ncbi:MAG: hypothetical protein AAGH92_04725 [Planctomycetota bacterium]
MHEPILRDWDLLAAPGDKQRGAPDLPVEEWKLQRIEDADHPAFADAYAALRAEFGSSGEVESADVLRARLEGPRVTPTGHTLHYHLYTLTDPEGRLVAVRDHTVIAPHQEEQETLVHLSHALVLPEGRGLGIGALLRTLPVLDAQLVRSSPQRVTLVAEMEHPDLSEDLPLDQRQARERRLDVYERAGFAMIEPYTAAYAQPCFTDDPDYPVVPLRLIVRRVDRELFKNVPSRQARKIVAALYAMYAADLPAAAMAKVLPRLERMPDTDKTLPLLPPTLAL